MLDQATKRAQMWTTVQEPRSPAYVPNSYLLLLSALDNGWQIRQVELAPSWDQHGFIYLVTLRQGQPDYAQQLILPKNALIDELFKEMNVTIAHGRALRHPRVHI
jgi:hypothetical protein